MRCSYSCVPFPFASCITDVRTRPCRRRPTRLPPPHGAGRAHATSRLTPARTEATYSRWYSPRTAPSSHGFAPVGTRPCRRRHESPHCLGPCARVGPAWIRCCRRRGPLVPAPGRAGQVALPTDQWGLLVRGKLGGVSFILLFNFGCSL